MAEDTRNVTQIRLTYEIIEDRLTPGDWRVEAIDYESEGECYIAIFCGPGAESRAREYAAWKNSHTDSAPATGVGDQIHGINRE